MRRDERAAVEAIERLIDAPAEAERVLEAFRKYARRKFKEPGMMWKRNGGAGYTRKGRILFDQLIEAVRRVEQLRSAHRGRLAIQEDRRKGELLNKDRTDEIKNRRVAVCARWDQLRAAGMSQNATAAKIVRELGGGHPFKFTHPETVLRDIAARG